MQPLRRRPGLPSKLHEPERKGHVRWRSSIRYLSTGGCTAKHGMWSERELYCTRPPVQVDPDRNSVLLYRWKLQVLLSAPLLRPLSDLIGTMFWSAPRPLRESGYAVPTFAGHVRFPDGGMVIGMATTKITITLEDEQLKEIRSLVAAGRAANTSAFVKHAVRVAISDAAGWREMLKDALDETGGPLTKKERAWADGILAPRPRAAKKGKAA